MFQSLTKSIQKIPTFTYTGEVNGVRGTLVEILGLGSQLKIGSRCTIQDMYGNPILAEVVGFESDRSLAMPFDNIGGIGHHSRVYYTGEPPALAPTDGWMGRILNCLGEAIDQKGPLPHGTQLYPLIHAPIPASERSMVGGRLDVGVKAINTFITLCRGQRMGIFAGSGIGKSILLSMLTRFTEADVIVVGLIGERGREVKEFLDKLDPETAKKTVVVVATSDESAMRRKNAAFTTMTVAEYFRDQGKEVLCLLDSVTRFAMAQREIGLAAGEPPASKGYTPTVFAQLPLLLERAGPGRGKGNITGLFTVLVDGDDHNEPIADAVRGILDGHIVLERSLADRGHYPAINILRSISRTMPDCLQPEEIKLMMRARALLATYEDMAEMIRLGAYKSGSDAKVDEAIRYNGPLMGFLAQNKDESVKMMDGFKNLEKILNERA